MRVMWVINSMIEEIAADAHRKAGFGGGWIPSMLSGLRSYRDIEVHVVVFGNVKQYTSVEKNRVRFHIFPDFRALHTNGGGKRALHLWTEVVNNAQPDIIHLYGTEQTTCLQLAEHFSNIPKIVSLQGIIREYYRQYYGDMSFTEVFGHVTIADAVLKSSGYFGRKRFGKIIPYEKRILCSAGYAEGRTRWDRAVSADICPEIKYYSCPRILRDVFYADKSWKADSIRRHTIFTHQGNYAIKGTHILIEALAIIKRSYPDVELHIAGQDPRGNHSLKRRLGINGYSRFLNQKIKSLDLSGQVRYLGPLNASEVAGELLRTHVMVVPSSIENSSNSIAEAMMLGTPCVASYVGGNPEMLGEGEYGLLYSFNDPVMLADAVMRIFRSDELAKDYSAKARAAAEKRHARADILDNIYRIYSDIISIHRRKEHCINEE